MTSIIALAAALATLQPSAAPTAFARAKWISPVVPAFTSPILRKEFSLARVPAAATLRIVGLGDYELKVNGNRVTPTGINQPWSQYEKTLFYADYDVTRYLRDGVNCIGVGLGAAFWHNPDPPAGRYNKQGPQRHEQRPYLLCAEVRDGDGQVLAATDGGWRYTQGPITFTHVYAGEDYDAPREQPGWDRPGFRAAAWRTPEVVGAPAGELVAMSFPRFVELRRDRPTTIKPMADGSLACSFPQNMASQLRVRLEGGKAGSVVRFRCAEHRNAEGRPASAYTVGCSVTTNGKVVDHQWSHFYLGQQFVEVTGAALPGAANPGNLPVLRRAELVQVRCGMAPNGTFTSSSGLYNRTATLVDWAMQANASWVMTDCPHREKLGWLECAHLLAPAFMYRYDARQWLAKITRDMRDSQTAEGMVRTVAPSYPAGRFGGGFEFTVEWGAAAVLTPWLHYQWYGDKTILSDNLECMKRFTDYVGSKATDGIAPGGLGDWYDYGHGRGPGASQFTPTELSATASWAMCAQAVADAAAALGDRDTESRYRKLHSAIAAAFLARFQDPVTRLLRHNGSPQCANAMALCAGIVPEGDRALLVADIIADLEKRGYQQTPGDIGHVYFIRALAQAGRSDILHKVYSREGTGSYGGILKKGLTSMPETWDAMMDGYQSLNHCMLGHVVEWFHGYVGGIRQAPGSVGWREILVAPTPGPLTSANSSVMTPKGRVASSWSRSGGKFTLVVTAPRGASVRAVLPSGAVRTLASGTTRISEADR